MVWSEKDVLTFALDLVHHSLPESLDCITEKGALIAHSRLLGTACSKGMHVSKSARTYMHKRADLPSFSRANLNPEAFC